MKKDNIFILVGVVIVLLIIVYLVITAFSSQYNEHGISHFLVITIDKNQEKEYLGDLDECKVYIEGLNIKETVFRTVDAENLSISDALKNKKVSLSDWKKYAWSIKKENNAEILVYENYEIYVGNEECIIKPK